MAMKAKSAVFMSPVLRASFVDVDKPNTKSDGTEGSYGLTLIIPKNDPIGMEWLQKFLGPQINQIAAESWPDPNRRPPLKAPVKDANTPNGKGTIPAVDWDYGDSFFIRVGSNRKPKVIGREKVGGVYVQLPPGTVESGNLVRVTACVYSFDGDANSGITFGLDAVQKVGAGTPFAGTSSIDKFDEIPLPQQFAEQAAAPQYAVDPAPQQAAAPQYAPQQAAAPQYAPQQAAAPQAPAPGEFNWG